MHIKTPALLFRSSHTFEHSVLADVRVKVSVPPGEAALGSGANHAVSADGASGEVPGDSAAVVADAELGVANADEGAVLGAGLAVAVGGGVVAGAAAGGARRVAGGSRGRGRRLRRGRGDGSCEGSGSLAALLVHVALDARRDSGGGVSGGAGGRGARSLSSRGRRCSAGRAVASGLRGRATGATTGLRGGLRVVVTLTSGAHCRDVLARAGEEDISRLLGLTSTRLVANVCNKERGEGTHLVTGTARDVDVHAVLVHFPIADRVEPGPRQNGMARLDALRHGDVPRVNTLGLSVGSAVCVARVEVTGSIGRAAALDAVDDVPVVGVGSLCGIGLVGDRQLARTTSVHSSVLAVGNLELKRERLASLESLTAGGGKGCAVAGEVAARLVKRVLGRVALKGFRLSDEHVSVGHAEDGGGRDSHTANGSHGIDHFRSKDWVRGK